MAKQIRPAAEEKAPATAPRALNPLRDMERLLESMFEPGWMRPLRWDRSPWEGEALSTPRMPRVDVEDRDKEILVRAEIPGVDRKDLDVSVTDNTVTIKGETRQEHEDREGDVYRREIARGAFARTVALPGEIDADKVTARFDNGILELTLPKVREATRRKIEVK